MNITVTLIGRHRWKVSAPFELGGIKVPVGFVTDGASIPRWLWWFEPPAGGRVFAPSVVHDFAMRKMGMSPKKAAFFFDRALRDVGVGRAKRVLVVAATRYLYRLGRAN